MVPGSVAKQVTKEADGTLSLHLQNGDVHSGFNVLLEATGRVPLTDTLALDKAGVATGKEGHILVDKYQNTNIPNVYALGDVCGHVELTPMAIAAGRRLADRLAIFMICSLGCLM